MSYNGIGLSTPRGSGTSGHIQANRSNLRRQIQKHDKPADFSESFAVRAPDQGILDHERKRRIEAQCFELQDKLEDDGVSAEDVEAQVSALRERLTAQANGGAAAGGDRKIGQHERHALAQAKGEANEKLRKALGIKEDHVEGLAFNREYQEEQKRVRAAAREEKVKVDAQIRAEREKANKEREEQRRRHQEVMARERRAQDEELERGRREHAARMRDLDHDGGAAKGGDRLPYGGAGDDNRRSRSPVRRDSRSPSPPPRSRRRYSDSRSPSPPRRSLSPPPKSRRRGRSPTRSESPARGGSRSRSPRRRSPSYSRSRSRSPPRRRARRDSPSRSRSRSPARSVSRSRSPPPARRGGGRDDSRSPPRSVSPDDRRR
ncbi:hypothetical protein JCM6882_009103 [Rhodosporidiobolus microsporus]